MVVNVVSRRSFEVNSERGPVESGFDRRSDAEWRFAKPDSVLSPNA